MYHRQLLDRGTLSDSLWTGVKNDHFHHYPKRSLLWFLAITSVGMTLEGLFIAHSMRNRKLVRVFYNVFHRIQPVEKVMGCFLFLAKFWLSPKMRKTKNDDFGVTDLMI